MSTDTLSPAILEYITNSTYPTDQVSSINLDSTALSSLLSGLQEAQNTTKQEIRALSASTAPDIDTWISHARTLQDDILRSRETARQIVAEAEEGKKLREAVADQSEKVRLLEKEVGFNEELTGVLEHVNYANGLLNGTREYIVQSDPEAAVGRLEDAEASIAGLGGVARSRVVEVLGTRARDVRGELEKAVMELWNELIQIDPERKAVRVHRQTSTSAVHDIGLEKLVAVAKRLGTLESLVSKTSKNIEKTILKPRTTLDADERVAVIKITDDMVSCSETSDDLSIATLMRDMRALVDYLANNLPSPVSLLLSEAFIPALSARLQEQWLEPAIPTTIEEIPAFDTVLEHVSSLAEQIETHGWHGSDHLRQWVRDSPRSWLTKQREATLDQVRRLVVDGLKELKEVERVETRVLRQDDPALTGANSKGDEAAGDDDWDTAWDEPDTDASPPSPKKADPKPAGDDDEDASAWGLEDDEIDAQDETPSKTKTDATNDGEEDAWGWGDDDTAATARSSASPMATKHEQAAPTQSLTLRETLTTTTLPTTLLAVIQFLVTTATTLTTTHSASPLSPAAPALYTLPTLALALYRATSPQTFPPHPVGNLLLYNDANQLALALRAWQSDRDAAGDPKLRLDPDLAALETFARRAYAAEMEIQRGVLRDLMDGAQGFARAATPPYRGECEEAVAQTVARVQEVAGLWEGVLTQGARLQSLGALVAGVITKMVAEVAELADISAEDSAVLHRLCEEVLGLRALFSSPAAAAAPGGDGGPNAGEAPPPPRDMTVVYVPNWLRFQYLAEILDSSLADIKYMWAEGELSLEFEAVEVVDLVEALFAESDLRRRAVAEIRRGRG